MIRYDDKLYYAAKKLWIETRAPHHAWVMRLALFESART